MDNDDIETPGVESAPEDETKSGDQVEKAVLQAKVTELQALLDSSDAKIGTLEGSISALTAQVADLKAANYDLLMHSAAAEADAEDGPDSHAADGGIDELMSGDK